MCDGHPTASTVIADLVMEEVEKIAIITAHHPPKWWLRYVDDSHTCLKKDHVNEFHQHLNFINPKIKFIVELEETTEQPDSSLQAGSLWPWPPVFRQRASGHEFWRAMKLAASPLVRCPQREPARRLQGLPFLDNVTTRSGTGIEVNAYRTSTHTDHYSTLP